MEGFAIDRPDGRDDGEDWTENYEEVPGGANISIILESTTKSGVGPRLHQTRTPRPLSSAAGRPPSPSAARSSRRTPASSWWCRRRHLTSSPPDRTRYEAVHIHANVRFVTEWLE